MFNWLTCTLLHLVHMIWNSLLSLTWDCFNHKETLAFYTRPELNFKQIQNWCDTWRYVKRCWYIDLQAGKKIVMAPSGVQKERMEVKDLFVLDKDGQVLEIPESRAPPYKPPKLSECSPLFMAVRTFICSYYWGTIKFVPHLALHVFHDAINARHNSAHILMKNKDEMPFYQCLVVQHYDVEVPPQWAILPSVPCLDSVPLPGF